MIFSFGSRPSDSPLVETIWRTESEGDGSFTSLAASHWEMVVTRQVGKTMLTVRGPETRARPAPIPVDAEFLGFDWLDRLLDLSDDPPALFFPSFHLVLGG